MSLQNIRADIVCDGCGASAPVTPAVGVIPALPDGWTRLHVETSARVWELGIGLGLATNLSMTAGTPVESMMQDFCRETAAKAPTRPFHLDLELCAACSERPIGVFVRPAIARARASEDALLGGAAFGVVPPPPLDDASAASAAPDDQKRPTDLKLL